MLAREWEISFRIPISVMWKTFRKNAFFVMRLIPQGTVDNNLGPDRLAGPKALEPNYCRQLTLWLHDLCLEVLTVQGTDFRLFGAKAFPLLILFMMHIWHSSIGTTFNVFIYDTGWIAEQIRYVFCHACSFLLKKTRVFLNLS